MAPSNLMPAGIWRPLNASRNEIRLLHVQPARFLEARVVCSLSTHSIDEIDDPDDEESYQDDLKPEIDLNGPLRFTAISYACGDIRDTTEIVIEGRPYPALTTLVSAIQHMRHERYEQIMWADQLCINQFDPEERAQQILLMKRIYVKASTMRVWFGLPEDYDYAKKFLAIVAFEPGEGLDQRIFDTEITSDDASDYGFPMESRDGFLPGSFSDLKGNTIWDLTRKEEDVDKLLRAMEHFISRPWFERVWTIQEYALASDRTCFHYGTIRTRRWMLQRMLQCIGSFVMNALYYPVGRRVDFENSTHLQMMAEAAFATLGRPFGYSASNAMGTLGGKIYSAGMLSYLRHKQKSSSGVVERRMNLFGDRIDNLKLTASRIQAIHMMAILDMRDISETVKFHSLVLATRSRFSTDPRDKVYGVLGLCHTSFVQNMVVDYRISFEEVYKRWATLAIQEVQKPFLLKNAQPHQPSTNLPSWVPDLSLPTPGEALSLLDVVDAYYNAWRRGKKFPLEICDGNILRCTSLPIDTIVHVIDLPNGHPRYIAYSYAMSEFMTIYGTEMLLPETSPNYIVEGTVHQAFRQTLHAGVIQNVAAEVMSGFSYLKRHLNDNSDVLPTIFHMDTTNARLFTTSMGYIGLSFAPDVKRGDKLVLVCDSRLPLILRKAPITSAVGIKGAQEDNVFRLVASAFVTGLMKGEIFKPYSQFSTEVQPEGRLNRLRRKMFEESDSGGDSDNASETGPEWAYPRDVDSASHDDFDGPSMRTESEKRRDRWLTKIGLKKDKKKAPEVETSQDYFVDDDDDDDVDGDDDETEFQPDDYYKEILIV